MIGNNSRADNAKSKKQAAGMIDDNKQVPQESKFDQIKRQLFCGFTGTDDTSKPAVPESPKSRTGRSLFKVSLRGSSSESTGKQEHQCANLRDQKISKSEPERSSCEHLVRMISDKNVAIDDYNERRRRSSSKLATAEATNEMLILLGSQKQQQTTSRSDPAGRKYSTGSEPAASNLLLLAKHQQEQQHNSLQTLLEPTRRGQSELLIGRLNELYVHRKQLQECNSVQLEESWTEFVQFEGSSQESFAETKSDAPQQKAALFSDSEMISQYKIPRNLKIQQDAIWELCSTEVNYLKRLRVVIDLFLSSLLELQRESQLLEIDAAKMSSNICEVYQANLSLWQKHLEPMVAYSRLRGVPLDPSMIGNAFLQIRNTFNPYYKYCLEHTACLAYVKEQTRVNDQFRLYVAWCESQRECERLRLMDLLAKPMQRLTRYSLLLKAIGKRTDNEDQLRSIDLMKKTKIAHMNKFVLTVDLELRRKEELNRLISISGSIESYAIATGELYSDEIDRIVKQNQGQFDLTRPLFNCPFQCKRELLFDSRTSFIHLPRASTNRWASYRTSNGCPTASGQNLNLEQHQQLQASQLLRSPGAPNQLVSNCSLVSATSVSMSGGSQRRARAASGKQPACRSLGQLKFRDLQMSGGKLDVTLLIFTDQLLVCRPAGGANRRPGPQSAATSGQQQTIITNHLSGPSSSQSNNNQRGVNLGPQQAVGCGPVAGGANNNSKEKQIERTSGASLTGDPQASGPDYHLTKASKDSVRSRGNIQAPHYLSANCQGASNSSSNEAEQVSCHSSTSSIHQAQQLRRAKEIFRASRRPDSSSRSGDNLENDSNLPGGLALNKPPSSHFRSFSFSNVILGSGLVEQSNVSCATSAGIGAGANSGKLASLRAIRSPYPIERLRLFELKDGQSVFCCQMNDSDTIATSFVLYTSACSCSREPLDSTRGSNSSGEHQTSSTKDHHELRMFESDTFNTTIKQLFNNLSGGGFNSGGPQCDRKRKQATPAAQLISVIRQAQARLHMAANFHGLQAANVGEQNNPVSSKLDHLDQPEPSKQQRRSFAKLGAWSSFRQSRKKSAHEGSQNNLSNPNHADELPVYKLGPATTNNREETNQPSGGFSEQSSNTSFCVPGLEPDQELGPEPARPRSRPKTIDFMLKAVVEQHQSMLVNHGLHAQLCSYNYNYRLQSADYNRVVAEPVSLVSTFGSVSTSSLSQSMNTTTNNEPSSNVCTSSRRVSSSDQLHYYSQPSNYLVANFNYGYSQSGSQNSVFEEASLSRGESPDEAAYKQQKQLLLSPHRYNHKHSGQQDSMLRGSLDSANRIPCGGSSSGSLPARASQTDRHRNFSRSARICNNHEVAFEGEQVNLMVTSPVQQQQQQQKQHSPMSSSSSSPPPPSSSSQTIRVATRAIGASSKARLMDLCPIGAKKNQPANSSRSTFNINTSSLSSDDQGSLRACTVPTSASAASGVPLIDKLSSGETARRAGSGRRNLSSLKRQNVVLSVSSDHGQQATLSRPPINNSNNNNNSSIEYSLLSQASDSSSVAVREELRSQERPLLTSRAQQRHLLARSRVDQSQANTMDQLSITLDDYDQLWLVPGSSPNWPAPPSQNQSQAVMKATSFELGQLMKIGKLPVGGEDLHSSHQLSSPTSGQFRSASVEARSPIAVTLTRPLNEYQEQSSASSKLSAVPPSASVSSGVSDNQQRISYLNIPQNKHTTNHQNSLTKQSKASSSSESYFYTGGGVQPRDEAPSTGSLSPIESNAFSSPIQFNSYQTVLSAGHCNARQTNADASSKSFNSDLSPDCSSRNLSFEGSADISLAAQVDTITVSNNPNYSFYRPRSDEPATGNRQLRHHGGATVCNNASRSFEYVNHSSHSQLARVDAGSSNRLRVALSDEGHTLDDESADEDELVSGARCRRNNYEEVLIDVNCISSLMRQSRVEFEESNDNRRYLGFHEKLRLHNKRLEEEEDRRRKESSSLQAADQKVTEAFPDKFIEEPKNAAYLRTTFSQLTHKSALNIKRAFQSRSARCKQSSSSNPIDSQATLAPKLAGDSREPPKRAQKSASLTRFDSFLHKATSLRSINKPPEQQQQQ